MIKSPNVFGRCASGSIGSRTRGCAPNEMKFNALMRVQNYLTSSLGRRRNMKYRRINHPADVNRLHSKQMKYALMRSSAAEREIVRERSRTRTSCCLLVCGTYGRVKTNSRIYPNSSASRYSSYLSPQRNHIFIPYLIHLNFDIFIYRSDATVGTDATHSLGSSPTRARWRSAGR